MALERRLTHVHATVIVEQNANLVLKLADYLYVLKHGKIVLQGTASEIIAAGNLSEAYLGA